MQVPGEGVYFFIMSISLWQQSRRSLGWLHEQIRFIIPLLAQAIQSSFSSESTLIAGSIGYYTLFSLFPLTLLTVALASLWIDPLLAESEIVTHLEFIAPALGDLLGANLEQIVRARGTMTGLAVLILLWSASNIFNVLTRASDRIWGIDITKARSAWRHRGLGILMALVLAGLLVVAILAEGTILTIVNSLLPEEFDQLRPLTNQFWGMALSVFAFMLLYYFLPHIKLTWRDVLPGALCAGLLWDLAERVFLLFVGTYLSRSNLIYGSVTTITAFLTWSYVCAIIFLLGGHLNRLIYHQWRTAPGKMAAEK